MLERNIAKMGPPGRGRSIKMMLEGRRKLREMEKAEETRKWPRGPSRGYRDERDLYHGMYAPSFILELQQMQHFSRAEGVRTGAR